MRGFHNRLLRIDLTTRSFRCDELPDSVLRRCLGGKGLGTHLLLSENPPGVDPLAPENLFVIAVGPLSDTKMWGSARFGVYSKGPATGGFAEAYCGGTLAPKIKGCGVDAVILRGRTPSLTFLLIDETGVRFEEAADTAGCDTAVTDARILELARRGSGAAEGRAADPSAMVIGPAGENLVRFACIKCDRWRSLGRCGMGAVLGSKNVKGIAFSRTANGAAAAGTSGPAGEHTAGHADEDLLKAVIRDIARKGRDSPVTETYRRFGTPSQVAVTNACNCFPTRYWQSGHFDAWENLSADYMQENFDVQATGCPRCFLRCTKKSTVRRGRHAGLLLEGPEYETIYALGGLNEVDSLEEVAYLNDLCDRLGMDTMSAGNLAAFAVEAARRGRLDFAIDYNQPDRMAELFTLIAHRRGVGRLFAAGIKPLAAALGLEDLAIHVKGLEPAGFDPRVLKGMGLSYATAARGACHLRGTFYKAELSGEIEPERTAGKAELLIDYEDRATLFDCLILCRFFRDFIKWEELGRLIEGSTGTALSREELALLANRVVQDTRRFNAREGLGPGADRLPRRFLEEATAEGASLSADELGAMLADYNRIRRERDAAEEA